ncbi:MAG: 3-methyl-2-oxobutanoate hydroxymethyltransferase [Candidatus Aureabacteria bacterium]|nr:3-methyl-2-oxobutanoate hydroxymethyltransferase [Candidatus Auribacterota bacterium]
MNTEDIKKMKALGKKIVAVTAYDWATASLCRAAAPDIVLVGDSLSMVALGYDNTLPVTVDEMVHHTKAVVRAGLDSLVVADMPFMSFNVSMEATVYNAGRFIKEAGAQAVKIEGGREVSSVVKLLVDRGIPVMGHVGLTPQDVLVLGGYKVQAKTPEKIEFLMKDAAALRDAGAFSVVLECVPAEVGKLVSASVDIPVIGIGAGPFCDGQIMVFSDLTGLYEKKKAKFVKVYADAGGVIKNAVKKYADEVRKGEFPDKEHSY